MLRKLLGYFTTLLLLLTCEAGYSQSLAPYPTATLTVSGSEKQPNGAWDSGNITIDFNGYVEIVNYGQYSSAASLASALAASFTRDFVSMGLYAKAGAHGALVDPTVITFQLENGSTFAPINIVDPSASFSFSPSGFASTATVADRGTATLTVAGTTVTATYGAGSTATTIAQDLALKANSPLVTVTSGGANLYLQSKQTTGSFSYPYSLSFSTATSFSVSPASGTLTGSADAAPVTVYSYSVTTPTGASGYQPNGNIQNVTDSVMGTWSYTYDNLNRLTSGTATSGTYAGQYTCWTYDSFGNRTSQSVSTTPCTGTPPATFAASYSANNRISSVSAPAGVSITYDGAGNVTYDGYNHYTYDAEGRVCALNGSQGMMGYQYGPDGTRIGKGTVTNWQSCDITSNGYTPMTDYVLDQGGGQMTEVAVGNGTLTPVHTNVTANGMLIATLDSGGWHFHLNDALGSRRAQTDAAGFPEQICQSLPFGDQLYCSGSLTSPTEHHFTGKERDAESGLDYFGARYYASNMGRWMSPDWSAKQEPVPYSKLDDPQTLNLYGYVGNNPLSRADADGHCWWQAACDAAQKAFGTASQLLNDGLQRVGYTNAASQLSGPGASAERKALQVATRAKLSPIGGAITDAAKASRASQLAGKTAEQLVESASRTNAGVNALGTASTAVGAAGVALGVGAVALDTVNAPAGQKLDAAMNGGARLGGSALGAEIGGAVGALGGPIGAVVGSLLGGAGGQQIVTTIQNAPPMDPQTQLELGGVP